MTLSRKIIVRKSTLQTTNNFLNKLYNRYRDLHTRIILNNVLKLLLIMQGIPIVENVCKEFGDE